MVRKGMAKAGLVFLLAVEALTAQYPGGQYPGGQYPGDNRYPGGQYPGSGLPMPRLPGRKSKDPAEKKPTKDEVLFPYTGLIREIKPESIVLEAEDTRVITFKCSKITRYLKDDKAIAPSDFKAGDSVLIESRKDDEGNFYAVNVKWQPKPAPAAKAEEKAGEKAEAPRSEVVKVPPKMTGADDEEPPKLKRGKPTQQARKKTTDEDAAEPASPAVVAEARPPEEPVLTRRAPMDKDEELIANARQAAEQFSERLPNFICNQMTTRFETEGRPVSWRAIDVVTASLVYEDGKESYHNIAVNGKPTKKAMEEQSGTWSTGEFGTTLRDVMAPYTDARFYNRRDSTASGLQAYKYDYEVERENSHWKTIIGGQYVLPAYKGSIWFDKKSARVLRIEMDARKIPEEFPADHIEWAVDYGFVRIGATEYLLPTHAENLLCWRGTSRCAKNAIDFRNYRKFTGESQILETDSTITFEGEEAKQPPKK